MKKFLVSHLNQLLQAVASDNIYDRVKMRSSCFAIIESLRCLDIADLELVDDNQAIYQFKEKEYYEN